MALDVYTLKDCLATSFSLFRIGNAYTRPINPPYRSVSPQTFLLEYYFPYLVADDFNIHTPAGNPFRALFSNKESVGARFFDRATDLGFSLLNTCATYTLFLFSDFHWPSAIALAFANPHMFLDLREWDASSLRSSGSDHLSIRITLQPLSATSTQSRPRWLDPDWPFLTERLKGWQIPPRPPPPPTSPSLKQLDLYFTSSLSILISTIETSVLLSRPFSWSKPWWTPLLTTLPKDFTKVNRKAK